MGTGADGRMHPGDDPSTPDRLLRVPSRLLARAAGHADRLVSGGLAGIGGHRWHYSVLVALHDAGPASQAALSRRTGIYRSDMVAVLNELEQHGYVRRTPDPADGRRNVITITPPGAERLARLDAQVMALQDDLLAPLTADEREQLVELLVRLTSHHSRGPAALPGGLPGGPPAAPPGGP
ncbi:MarR family winged helix-turn-helix transcriptional regulator [Plantactinospora sp. KBS50]|uniref:MarR family winged helix-turn-helix transcriptional regulator n=1 Tax=Plantactinospora sp. KBS50 TaxID=2024580 RepID=UPI000BAAFB6F|nr:MarR family transcriptional regulator [Plantactinospora sp. KBS50]ASW52941.1 MarR family transcriptional regulator [Plantactinospora sp. KBS50]